MNNKQQLLQQIIPYQRGLKITSAQLEAVRSLIRELENLNPNPKPTNLPDMLKGNWKMLFTTSKSILGFDRLPLTSLGEIYQFIDTDRATIYNIAELQSLPLLSSVVSVIADFTIVSDKRIGVKFTRSVVGFQSLLQYQNADDFITKLSSGNRFVALDTKIKGRTDAWVDITYLDNDLRITRGNEGNIFILRK